MKADISQRLFNCTQHGNSWVHRQDARLKIIFALAFILLLVSTPPQSLLVFVLYFGLLLWLCAWAALPFSPMARRCLYVLPFSLFVALGLPFLPGGERASLLGLSLSIPGLWLVFAALIKSILGFFVLSLLMATTPFAQLLLGLRSLGVPLLLLDLLTLSYRYAHLLAEEALRLRRAARARGYAPKWLPQSVIVGRLIGVLFIRSYERAERIHAAMRLRGYTGQLPAAPLAPLRPAQAAAHLLALLALVAIRLCLR